MDKILLIGLNHDASAMVEAAATTLEAATFITAGTVDEIRQLGREHDFGLIISETGIEETDAYLHALPGSTFTPLLLIGTPEQRPELSDAGTQERFLDSITPPLTPAIVRGRIQTLLHINRLQRELLACQTLLRDQQDKNDQWRQSMEQQSHYLNMLSIRDGLTGLFNRRHLRQVLEQEIEKAIQTDTDLTLLLLDIDYFNETNRIAGQHFGDSILNELAARLTQHSRNGDLCFRFGGSDFIVLLPGTNKSEGIQQAENLRRACSDKPFTSGHHSRSVTVSIGMITLREHCPRNPDEFLSMAEKSIYQAKSQGRNRVVVYNFNHDAETNKIDSITLLRETLNRILEKTKDSSIASIQILTQNVTGTTEDEHVHLATRYIRLLCERLGLPDAILDTFTNALILYNSFRLLLYRELLAKKETFTHEERKMLQDLPYKMGELTQHFDYFANERTMLLCQGEHYDGSGYPEGLAGEEIPLASRIFSLANGLAAMNADRPHRKRLSPRAILDELRQGAGTQWDPSLVLLALDIVHEQQLIPLDETLLAQTKALITRKIAETATRPAPSLPQEPLSK